MNHFFKIFFITFLFFFALHIFAADIRIQTSEVVSITNDFLVHVILDSSQSINAIEGTLIYPSELLSVKEIRDGDSVINFWMESPVANETGKISFSGITPGGFSGEDNSIFTVLFEAKKIGEANLGFQGVKVLLNDGQGTATTVALGDEVVSIKSGGEVVLVPEVLDTEIPEDFTPILAQDPNLFDGKYFLVFSTKDKISGIDHYAIREGTRGEFENVDSPYLLKDQTLHKKIFMRAIDKAQNVREVVFDPQKKNALYKNKLLFAIILLLGVMLVYNFRKKIWQKYSN